MVRPSGMNRQTGMNDSQEGKVLNNKYRLLDRIGVGGMAMVYKAVNVETDAIVAVKILRDEYNKDEEFIKRFHNEATAAARLSHPNIVEIYDVGNDGDTYYIVMEYVDGVTLKDYIDALQTMKWQDALKVTAQILSAVDHAHKRNIIHRDIKPMNIMVTDQGIIKLTDFGIARAVSGATITAGDSAGSVHYLSPEQARGGFVDERSDIYSIGITLYEMVTGVVPFDGESHVSIALKHLDGKIVPPREVDPEIPWGVNDLIVMATKKDPGARFQSAQDMLSRLQKVYENPAASFLNEDSLEDEMETYTNRSLFEADEQTPPAGPILANEEEPDDRYPGTGAAVRNVTLTTVTYILAILVTIGAVAWFITFASNIYKQVDDMVEIKYSLDDYTGLPASMVVGKLEAKGIKVEQILQESDTYPQGYVIGQSIAKGGMLYSKETVKLYVSSEEGSFVLENYARQDFRAVEQALQELGVQTRLETISSNTIADGYVVRTSPASGTIITPGDTVIIYRSQGKMYNTVSVPNLTGYTLQEAMDELSRLGLNLGMTIPKPGEDLSSYFPVSTPSPDTSPEGGTPQPGDETPMPGEETPGPTPDSSSPTPPLVASDRVVAQYPKAGTELFVGESVDVYFYDRESIRPTKDCTFTYPENQTPAQPTAPVDPTIPTEPTNPDDPTPGIPTPEPEWFRLKIEAFPSDRLTNDYTVVFPEQQVSSADCPIAYSIPMPFHGGMTIVRIYVNGSLYCEMRVTG